MKQKTAIRLLIEKLESIPLERDYYKLGIVAAIRIAHELESVNEQQIKDAHEDGFDNYQYGQRNGNGYFNETFENP